MRRTHHCTNLPRSFAKYCIIAYTFLITSDCHVDGRAFSQVGVKDATFLHYQLQHECGSRPDIDFEGGHSYNVDHSGCRREHVILYRSLLSVRGGAEDVNDACKHNDDTNIQTNEEETRCSQNETTVVVSTDSHRKNQGELNPKKNFLSFLFRQNPSTVNEAAVKNKMKVDPDKIPHGPTGGGYAATAATSESVQEDGHVLIMENELTETDMEENQTPSLSTYPSAFAINRGRSIQSMQELVSRSNPNRNGEVHATTLSDKNATQERSNQTFITSDGRSSIVSIETATLNTTETKIANSINTTYITQEIDFQNVHESAVNVTVGKDKLDYTSSGYVSLYLCLSCTLTPSSKLNEFLILQWVGIDLISSFGLSTISEDLKISKALRPVRKAVARATGLRGFLSGKPLTPIDSNVNNQQEKRQPTVISIDEELGIHVSTASEAETAARKLVKPLTKRQQRRLERRAANRNRNGRRWGLGRRNNPKADPEYIIIPVRILDESPDALERRRKKRVEEIDELLKRGSARLMELQCEKDDLQQAPNPLFNYTKQYDESSNKTFGDVRTSREFNFPPKVLVDDYIEELIVSRRLVPLNHTDIWQFQDDNQDDDEIGDDLFTPSADAKKLYQNLDRLEGSINASRRTRTQSHPQNSGGGSWLLRTGFGNGGSLGEKLGETIETQAYKAVTASVMMVLARILSALHGINVMNHSDIRLYVEDDPDLPPIDKDFGSLGRDNYAQQAIKTVIQKGAKKKRKHDRSSTHSSSRRHGHELSEAAFIQRDAVVETLISHCQISAPLLKLFPLDWQRAIVGNIITLVTAVISDFADGIQLQILGHSLSFSFKPITEADLFQHIGVGGFRQNHRRSRPDEFEYAVWATAEDISKSLSFLGDGWLGWLEKKIGGGILISQLSNLIARVVLTLIDEVLSGARLDLWAQANGPRLFAALEYRSTGTEEENKSI